MNCPACAVDVAATSLSCPSCGASLRPSAADSPTRTFHVPVRTGASSRAARLSSSDTPDHGRFLPGTILLDRYRIQGLLGRGGMGEVYRADDLTLGQQVALKFLPQDLAQDADRLARFRDEVRLARQVSHPSVCRVYDIAEVDGQSFLSMEYIDGEDLAALLRRIGRLPSDKALEIARQICAGLAAAHDRGVLHRDLKPSNVMLDGRGRARITDFGLASVAGSGGGGSASGGSRAGTPLYMAPEQLTGEEATERSDLYAVGLVLYELFTGQRAFRADSLAELTRSRVQSGPPPPSTLVDGLDPAVERVILRCLEKDPRDRPATALAVAAGLPGGDPLAMALAAGETPSPEMVAAAGETGGLTPAAARACLAGLLAGALVLAWLAGQAGLLRRVSPPRGTEVLVDRVQDLIRRLGYTDPPAGVAYGYGYHRSYLEYVRDTDSSPDRWDRLSRPRPPAMFLWYRQSPRHLLPAKVQGVADLEDPPPLVPGMVSVTLTSSGDLWDFGAVPPQLDEGGSASGRSHATATAGGGPDAKADVSGSGTASDPRADWGALFREAGLDIETFAPVPPRWVPPVFGDARAAWEGTYPDASDLRVRIEAASYRGRPVFFHVYWPWNRPLRSEPFRAGSAEEAAGFISILLVLSVLVWGALLARRNVRMGRVDRKGAFRLAVFVFAAGIIGTVSMASHVKAPGLEWGLLTRLCGSALYAGFVVWLLYIALEPLVRRRWPDGIISWTRLLGGRFQDPLVGRDLLIGVTTGIAMVLVQTALMLTPAWLGRPPLVPGVSELDLLVGPRLWIAGAMNVLSEIVPQALVMMFLLSVLRLLFRRQWAALLGFSALGAVVLTLVLWQAMGPLAAVAAVALSAMLTFAVVRSGLLALATSLYAHRLFMTFPMAGLLNAWYALPGWFVFLVLAAVVAYAVRAALANRSLLEFRLLQE